MRARPRLVASAAFAILVLTAPRAAPDPTALPTDPAIESMLGMVSADSLESYVQTLVDFFTRNTNSDTLSQTEGIGAARNWVHSKFASFGQDQEGATIEPGFFPFEANICNIDGSHKNVTGEIPGTVSPDRIFLVGGHLDSRTVNACDATSFQPAANDDGSGVAAAIEMARIISANLTPENTLIFQAFVGEEQGLVGSEHYAEWAAFNGLNVEGMLNNDTIGNIEGCPDDPGCGTPTHVDSSSVRCFSGDPATGRSRQLSRYGKMIGEAYVPEMTVNLIPAIDRPGRGGDHIPFHEIGYASIRYIETLEMTTRQHNSNDAIQWIDFNYHRRNTQINLAVFSNLALAPPTPSGVQVFDQGSGGTIEVRWSDVSALAGDVGGYRVAYRFVSQGDSLFYADIIDAGADTSLVVSGLQDEVTLAVSVSAYDIGNHESIFSAEKTVTPGVSPHTPSGFTVSSQSDRIRLDWDPAQELDLEKFLIERSLDPDGGFALLDSADAEATSYEDFTAAPETFYYYRLSSVDLDDNQSPPTAADEGRLAEHQIGLLLVDASRDGGGGVGQPSDEQVDDFYAGILDGYPVLAQWDWVDQYDNNGVVLSDAHMAQYKTVFIHSDRNLGTIGADSTEIRQYVANGGQVWISGWEMKHGLGGIQEQVGSWGSNSFMYQVMKVDSLRKSDTSEQDFAGAIAIEPGFPKLTTDPVKWPFGGGNLFGMDGMVGEPLDGATPLYIYDSNLGDGGSNNGRIDGLKFPDADPTVFFVDIPLYFMDSTSVRVLAEVALSEFGYGAPSASAPDAFTGDRVLLLQNSPNPFRQGTSISFFLPREQAVELRVVDVAGRVVRSLVNSKALEPGWRAITWDARDGKGHETASGIYFYVLDAGEERLVRRMVVMR